MTTAAAAPDAQSKYQVRFDLAPDGLRRIGAADVVVWVDALAEVGSAAGAPFGEPSVDLRVIPEASVVIGAALTNRSAVAQWIVDRQVAEGRRLSISVIAASGAGGLSATDVLASGAVIDALVARGVDFTSPEAAIACAGFDGLQRAVRHLFSASVDSQRRIHAATEPDRASVIASLAAAADTDSSQHVVVIRGA